MQLNSYINQKERFVNIGEKMRTMENELSAPLLQVNSKKRKFEARMEKCRRNKHFALETIEALETKLLGYKKLVAVNETHVKVICDLKNKKGWHGKVFLPKDVNNFERMRKTLMDEKLHCGGLDVTHLILGGLSSEKIWN